MKIKNTILCMVAVFLTGCATTSSDVKVANVGTGAYQHLECGDIADEEIVLSKKIRGIAGEVDADANKSKTAQAVGWVLFWPAFFFAGQDSQSIAELSRLKGEYEALKSESIAKDCKFTDESGQQLSSASIFVIDRLSGTWEEVVNLRGDGGTLQITLNTVRQDRQNRWQGRLLIKPLDNRASINCDSKVSIVQNVEQFMINEISPSCDEFLPNFSVNGNTLNGFLNLDQRTRVILRR